MNRNFYVNANGAVVNGRRISSSLALRRSNEYHCWACFGAVVPLYRKKFETSSCFNQTLIISVAFHEFKINLRRKLGRYWKRTVERTFSLQSRRRALTTKTFVSNEIKCFKVSSALVSIKLRDEVRETSTFFMSLLRMEIKIRSNTARTFV